MCNCENTRFKIDEVQHCISVGVVEPVIVTTECEKCKELDMLNIKQSTLEKDVLKIPLLESDILHIRSKNLDYQAQINLLNNKQEEIINKCKKLVKDIKIKYNAELDIANNDISILKETIKIADNNIKEYSNNIAYLEQELIRVENIASSRMHEYKNIISSYECDISKLKNEINTFINIQNPTSIKSFVYKNNLVCEYTIPICKVDVIENSYIFEYTSLLGDECVSHSTLEENKKTTIVKLKRHNGVVVQDCDVYIGYKCYVGGWKLDKTKWTPPFSAKEMKKDIPKYLQQYKKYVEENLLGSLDELRGKTLGCWCDNTNASTNASRCHGSVLLELIHST